MIFQPYLGMIKIAAVVAATVALSLFWYRQGAQGVQADWDKEKLEAAEMTLATERETRRAIDTITMNSRKENDRAKATIESLRADVRNGTERLSVATESCQPGDSGARHSEARCFILPTTGDSLIQLAGDADQAVRELNECVDKYEAARNLLKNDKPQ